MSGCLTTTGSWLLVSSRWSQYPWKPPLRPLAPAALQMGGRRRRGVSDKGTVCSVGKNKAEGERSSRVEQTGIRTTCVFYFTRQGHRVWEIYLSISFRTPLASGKKKKKKKHTVCRANIFPKQRACQRKHRPRRCRQRGQNGSWTEMSRGKNRCRVCPADREI